MMLKKVAPVSLATIGIWQGRETRSVCSEITLDCEAERVAVSAALVRKRQAGHP